MKIFSVIYDFFFGPEFKVGDIINRRGRESWEENLPITILEVGHRHYRASVQYRMDKKIITFENTIPFYDELYYKKVSK